MPISSPITTLFSYILADRTLVAPWIATSEPSSVTMVRIGYMLPKVFSRSLMRTTVPMISSPCWGFQDSAKLLSCSNLSCSDILLLVRGIAKRRGLVLDGTHGDIGSCG